MPITRRSPERWAELVEEVKRRSASRPERKRTAKLKERERRENEAHREARRRIRERLRWLNDTVKSGRYVDSEISQRLNQVLKRLELVL